MVHTRPSTTMFTGPTQIDTFTNNGSGSFFFPAPIFFNNGTDRFLCVQKSNGVSWQLKFYKLIAGVWTLQDAANGPLVSRGVLAGLQTPFSCPTGIIDPTDTTKAVIAYVETTAAKLSIVRFNMAANGGLGLWEAPITTAGPVVHGIDLVFPTIPPNSAPGDDTGSKACIAYRPNDNKFVFNFQGAPEVVAGDNCLRPNFVTFDRGALTWSAPVIIAVTGEDVPYCAHGIITDQATGISYVSIVKPNNGRASPNDTDQEIWYVQIDADNTIHPKVLMANDVLRQREPVVAYPVLQNIDGNKVFSVIYKDNVNGGVLHVKAARGIVGVAPAFVQENVSTDNTNGPVNDSFATGTAAVGDDGTIYSFWIGSPNPNNEYILWMSKSRGVGSGWDAPTAMLTTNPATDFLERINSTSLLGLHSLATIEVAIMDAHIQTVAAVDSSFSFELALDASAIFGGPFKLNSPQPVKLPDPRLLCDHAQQKRCITFQGEELQYQGSKGVFYVVRQ